MATFVIVHGAWHEGQLFEGVASFIRQAGHEVVLPTIAGNGAGADKSVGLAAAIGSIAEAVESADLSDIVLCGHSYGGMIITGVADRIGDRIRRLVYWNAFVPNDGESLNDMVPDNYVALFSDLTQPDGSVMLPFEVWREAFINDADLDLAQSAFDQLNPHPGKTFSDGIELSQNPAEFSIPKSYVNCTEDIALPHSLGWHPRLSEKLGVFRLIQIPGSHELCFTHPERLAKAFMAAGRD
ncbi:MAG: alpha/beta hydrolase [Pseudomonadota bacterium]